MFLFGPCVAGPRPFHSFMRIIVKFELTAADSPNDTPTMITCEPAQLVFTQRVEKSQLSGMRDKVFGSAGELLRDNASHRLEQSLTVFVHGKVNRL